jgi:hypothetical protein
MAGSRKIRSVPRFMQPPANTEATSAGLDLAGMLSLFQADLARDTARGTKLHIFICVAGRYGRCRISWSVRPLMSKGPAPPLVAAQCKISAEAQSQPWPGGRRSRSACTSFSQPLLIQLPAKIF